MRKRLVAVVSFVLAGLVSAVSADDHMFTGGLDSQAPFNLQGNLCTLNPGKTMAQYDRMVNDYFAWSVKNNVLLKENICVWINQHLFYVMWVVLILKHLFCLKQHGFGQQHIGFLK